MHHPGPPRFIAVGDVVELAPRDPDPEATYEWSIHDAPIASTIELPEGAVIGFTPDAAGTYRLELDAPDGTHRQTVRVFPSDKRPADVGAAAAGRSGLSGFSGSGSLRPSGRSGRSGQSGVSGSGSGAIGESLELPTGRPRIRLDGGVSEDGERVVVRATPTPHPDSARTAADLSVEFVLDDRDGVSRSDVTVTDRTVEIPAAVLADVDQLRVHGVAVGDSYSVADAVSVSASVDAVHDGDGFDVDAVDVLRLNDPPEWATDATLYEVYVRGFANGDDEADTTFEAIENRLPYLEELGVDTLWLTPVLQHDGKPHGYNITDFFSIADDLGDRESYESLVAAAHDRGMSVLFDLVLNHSARDHPFFEDAYQNPESPYYDWYEWQDSGEPGTYFDWELIANFDYSNLEVRRHLLDAVDEWAAVADGFRCDMAWAVPDSFWREIRERVKARDRDFLLLDETIPYIEDFHEGMFDVHFDTTLYFTLRQIGRGHEPAEAMLDAIDGRTESGFPDHAAFMLYLENHDETRYLVECGDDAAFAAAGALFTLPGIPMLYSGQELGQRGRRDAIAWEHARDDVRSHYDDLIELEAEHEAVGFGGELERIDYGVTVPDDSAADADDAVAFVRSDDEETLLVCLHFGPDTVEVGVDRDVDATDLVSGDNRAAENGLTVEDVAVFEITE
ncbi:alpha-amylase MalA [Halalkalirubrum salinum]|uniref:alpha-amylase MalA n=1 Tax=Halalkalirubrum salinum TaxID=2563889 RepID=UPI001F10EA34|nr:alpha-amylase MalA [Halalkalirubrum salinum]